MHGNRVALPPAEPLSAAQYRDKFMISPAPIVRPVIGDWAIDGLLDTIPPRPPPATEKLRKIMDFYLHSMVFHKDRLGRPVRPHAQVWTIDLTGSQRCRFR